MSCEELAELYELYALGVLEGDEKEAMEEHLGRNCEVCMTEIRRAARDNAEIFRAVPKTDPSAALRSRVLAGFGIETRPFWLRAMPWGVALAAAAVAVLMFVAPISQRPSENTESALDFLSTPGTRQVSFGAEGPHGSVLVQEKKGVLLVVVNLPAAPEGKMYETWIVPRKGDPKPTGQLKLAKNGNSVGLIPGPIDANSIGAVAVSLEPAGSNPVKPTTVVFAAPMGT